MTPPLKLFVLGHPRLERDGTPVELGLRKALALLVYLAVTGQPHGREFLAAMLWPESDQRESRARLRRMLYRLTDVIGDAVVDSGPAGIRLNPHAQLWLDSTAFLHHATAGLTTPSLDSGEFERLGHLQAAAALYSEEFLAGFALSDTLAFEEWQFFERESLRQRYSQVLQHLMRIFQDQQDWGQAIHYGRRWVALDGLHEPAQRELIALYAQAGQHAAALRQYQACVHLLQEELGAAPEHATLALYDAIRSRQFPYVAAPPPPAMPAVHKKTAPAEITHHVQPMSVRGGPGSSYTAPDGMSAGGGAWQRFVGREQELAQLERILDTALAGQGQVAFVIGDSGQGKSALLQAFAERAQQAHPDLIVVGGSCNAYSGDGDPHLPFREILELLTGDSETRVAAGRLHRHDAARLWDSTPVAIQALLDEGSDLIDTLLPGRAFLRRAAAYDGDAPPWAQQLREFVTARAAQLIDTRQQQLCEQYARVLETIARQRPMLLLLDDLHWIDPGSATLLHHLGRRLRGSRIMILGAYRPAEVALGRNGERHPLESVLNELRRNGGQIGLELSRADGRAFVDALLDSEPNLLDATFHATLYRETGGHALFTRELLRDLCEQGTLMRDRMGRWVLNAPLNLCTLPARIEGAIGERLDRLPPPLRELLQIASVEGEEFMAEVVARVLGTDEQTVVRRLSRELDQTHHLVRALGVRHDDDLRFSRFRFEHRLIRHFLYCGLNDIERTYQHEAIGQVLERLYRTRVAAIDAACTQQTACH